MDDRSGSGVTRVKTEREPRSVIPTKPKEDVAHVEVPDVLMKPAEPVVEVEQKIIVADGEPIEVSEPMDPNYFGDEADAAHVYHPQEDLKPVFLPLDTAPMDGTRLWLVGEDECQVEAHWHRTRRFVPGKTAWEDHGFWAFWPANLPIGFEPIGWIEAVV